MYDRMRQTPREGSEHMELQANGAVIHYELSGQGSNRVVLLHGWGCDTSLMKPVADDLARDMQVLSLDFPGHGKSSRPPEPWGVPEYAAATLEALRQLNFLPCAVIAHSFGGRVAAYLAAEDSSLFTKLIFTGAAGIKKPQTEEGRRRTARYKRLKGLCRALGRMSVFGSLPEKMEEKLRQKYGSRDYNALDADMRQTFVKVISLDLSDRYREIRQPTLLIWGDQDTETPLWMGRQMERDIPDAGLAVLEGGTHFAYLEQVQRFNKIARVFLMEEAS